MADVKRVYTFGNKEAEGNGKMRELLGGKGANLAEMNLIGIPVPPGFTITTEVCAEFYKHGKEAVIEMLRPEVERAMKNIEKLTGMKFGDKEMPLLVSVRSGYRSLTCCRQSPKIISSRSPMIQLFIITLSRSFLHLITQIVYAVFIPFATPILYISHNLYLLFFDSLHNGACRPYHI